MWCRDWFLLVKILIGHQKNEQTYVTVSSHQPSPPTPSQNLGYGTCCNKGGLSTMATKPVDERLTKRNERKDTTVV